MPASLLLLLGFLALTISAQKDYAINKIDIPTASNGTATIVAGTSFLSFVNATVADSFVYAVCIFASMLQTLTYSCRIILVASS
jgi:hypothetical protein